MKVNCHQMLKGHSSIQGYNAPKLESIDPRREGHPKTFTFGFTDEGRTIPDNDRNNYVLEIEPVNSNFDCTAAICAQITDVGTPAVYTSWLVPENGDTRTTLQVLNRKNFLTGQEMQDIYERGKPLTMRTVEVPDQFPKQEWNMNDGQRALLGQFLALYWMNLVRNRPSISKPKSRLLLVLRENDGADFMKNEEAVQFFEKEIISRLPREALPLVSAVFGVRHVEAEKNFSKAVCVILSTDVGAPQDKRIDLFKGNQDIIRGIPSRDDREALKAIAQCLMNGEQNYPAWYIRLRELKNGIPKLAAPMLMYMSYILQALDTEILKPVNPVHYYEQCCFYIYSQVVQNGVSAEEILRILHPLLQDIISKWCSAAHPDAAFYHVKLDWLHNQIKIPEDKANEYIEPLAKRIFQEITEKKDNTQEDKIAFAVELLKQFEEENGKKYSLHEEMERYLSENFEEWIFADSEHAPNTEISDASLTRILENWNSSGLKRQPDEVKQQLGSVIEQFKNIPETVTNHAMHAVDILCLKALIENCRKKKESEELTVEELENLANQLHIVGSDSTVEEQVKSTKDIIDSYYHIWSLEKPVYIYDDKRFLDIGREWLAHGLGKIKEYGSEDINKIEENIIRAFNSYDVRNDEQDTLLAGLRREKGLAMLGEIDEDDQTDDTTKALKIAGLHQQFRRVDNVLQGNDNLSKELDKAITEKFLAWNKAEKPFASSVELQYRDNWFVDIADLWLRERLKEYINDFNAEELHELESNIKAALDAYRIPEEQKNRIMEQVRLARFDAQISEIRDDQSLTKTEKALKTAGIHCALKKIGGLLDDAKDLEAKAEEEMLSLYCDWAYAEKPFSSGEDLRYDDNWFVDLTHKWIETEMDQAFLSASELEDLEKYISEVLTIYKITKDEQNKLLLGLRAKWAGNKLDEQYDKADDDAIKALNIADIHNRIRHYPEIFKMDSDLALRLTEGMRSCFLAWEKTEKPFISGHSERYEDDWFVSVAGEWLSNDLNESVLNSEQMEHLEKDLIDVFGLYRRTREQQNKDLLPLRAAWCRAKLADLRQSIGSENDPEYALSIAGIHDKLIHQVGIDEDDSEELEKDLQTALRNCYVAWSFAEKPFASSTDLKYEDGRFFEAVTRDWLLYDLKNTELNSEQLEKLEEKLKSVFSIYKVFREKQNEMLLDLRRAWGSAKIRDIQLGDLDRTQQALSIAGIHNKLRQYPDLLEEGDDLSRELDTAIQELFLDWGNAEKPFASNEQLRYEDDWFVTVASSWLQNDTSTANMDDVEISKLEENFTRVLSTYHVSREKQNEMLGSLRLNMYMTQLGAIHQDMNSDETQKALRVASIHNKCKQITSADPIIMEDIEREIRSSLRESFVAWSKADKPFVSGPEMKYDDELFVSVAKDWLQYDLQDTELTVDELDDLMAKIKTGLIAYRISRDNQIETLIPLQKKYGEEKIQNIIVDYSISASDKALRIADLHNQLRATSGVIEPGNELDNLFRDSMMDYFVEWSFAEKPFASGLNMRYEDEWFGELLQRWCEERLNSTDMNSEQFSEFVDKVESAARSYRLRDWEDIRKTIREKNVEICILEESGMALSSENSICKIAEMILRGDVDPKNGELYQKAISYMADNFEKWAMTEPAFRLPESTLAAYQLKSKGVFLDMMKAWQDEKLSAGNIELKNAGELRERIRRACDVCRIPNKEYEDELRMLDLIICQQKFEAVQDETVTPETVVSIAGVRRKLEELNDGNKYQDLMNEITYFLKTNVPVWLDAGQPLSVEGYGYKDPQVPLIAEDWLNNNLQLSEWSVSELKKFRQKFTDASKQYRIFSGKEIDTHSIQAIDILESDAYIRELPEAHLSEAELKHLAGLLETVPADETDIHPRIKRILLQHFPQWADCQPPFSSDGMDNQYNYLPEIAQSWTRTELQATEMSSEELRTLYEKLQAVRQFHRYEDSESILNDIKLRMMVQRLQEIARKQEALSENELAETAGIYELALQTDDFRPIAEPARKELMSHFYEWATAGNFKSNSFVGTTTHSLQLDEMVRQWLDSSPEYYIEEMDLHKIRENFEFAAQKIYKMEPDKINGIVRQLRFYEAEQLVKDLGKASESIPGDSLTRAMTLYGEMLKQNEKEEAIFSSLKNALLADYDQIVSSEECGSQTDGFISLTESWLDEELMKKQFDSSDAIKQLQQQIEKKYKAPYAERKQINHLKASFEICWMLYAVDSGNAVTASVSEIAGTEARVTEYGEKMNQQYMNELYQFLNIQFMRWSLEGFRSEHKNKDYTFSRLPELAKEWLAQNDLASLSVEKLSNLSEKLNHALSEGYNISQGKIEEIVAPVDEAQKLALFKQVLVNPTEENIYLLRDIYMGNPEQYASRVFHVYKQLAKEEKAAAQITEFIGLQNDVYDEYRDTQFRIELMMFLDDLWAIYGSNRPEELQDAMTEILGKEHYQLPEEKGGLQYWNALKNRLIERRIVSYLKSCLYMEYMEEQWDRKHSEKYGTKWADLTQYPFFKEALKNWFDEKWKEVKNDEEKIAFISEMAEASHRQQNPGYQKLLAEILFRYVVEGYQALYVQPEWQETLDNVLNYIASLGVNISEITGTALYGAGKYCRAYDRISREWDEQEAVSLLHNRITLPVKFQSMLKKPEGFEKSRHWLLQLLMYEAPFSTDGSYWEGILFKTGMPALEDLNKMDLKTIGETTSFMENLQWCFENIPDRGSSWLADDLKTCLKTKAQVLWKSMHQGLLLSSNIKKLVKGGWKALPDDFAEWLRIDR